MILPWCLSGFERIMVISELNFVYFAGHLLYEFNTCRNFLTQFSCSLFYQTDEALETLQLSVFQLSMPLLMCINARTKKSRLNQNHVAQTASFCW